MSEPIAFTADRIFDGEQWLTGQAVLVEEGRIVGIIPDEEIPPTYSLQSYRGNTIVPAFIDIQLYGAQERLFSVYQDEESLRLLAEAVKQGGAVTCQPTLATNTYEVFYRCIDAMRAYWANGGQHILGLHLEGPWINADKRGAHIKELVQLPDIEEVKELLEYGKEVIKTITLAPEVCNETIISLVQSYNIIISAGHSNASYDQAIHGFDKGIKAVTHLYNAMSPLQHRAPGLVGATFDDMRVSASIIPDGHHVDYAAIRIAKKIMGDRLFVITDAVTATTEGPYRHVLAGDKYESNGILSGSALSMIQAAKNLVAHCDIAWEEALRMCSLYPARVMQIDDQYGRVIAGHRAAFTVLNQQQEVVEVIGS